MLDTALENNVIVADRLRGITVEMLGVPIGPDLDRALIVAVEAADAVLKLAFRSRSDGDPELIAECKHLVRRYLSAHLSRNDPGSRALRRPSVPRDARPRDSPGRPRVRWRARRMAHAFVPGMHMT